MTPTCMMLPLQPTHLNALDLVVIGIYLVLTILTGIAWRRKAHSSTQFLHAQRSIPTSVAAISFLAANCGALEIVGIVSTSAKYGAAAFHYYWVGALPGMLMLGLFMMPIYLGSGALTVPDFLRRRFGEATRTLTVLCSGVIILLVSGIGLYALAQVLHLFLDWRFGTTVFLAALIVLTYVWLGGLTATIYNEVLQFALILAGLCPLAIFALREFHGIDNLWRAAPLHFQHTWVGLPFASPGNATMDVLGLGMGLGVILGCGYWCTDYVLIQRALAAKTTDGAIYTPLLACIAKMLFPFLLVIPGMVAAILFHDRLAGNYDQALPILMQRYYRHGMLGVGITAILASLMSALAANVSALSSIWTHDIYQVHIARNKSERHYVAVGRIAMVAAILLSTASAYLALNFNNLMDYLQLLFSLFNAPLFATFVLGMFTVWATEKGSFWGLLTGIVIASAHNIAYRLHLLHYGSDMNANFYGAILGWSICLIATTVVSRFTPAKPLKELTGITYRSMSGKRIHIPKGAYVLAVFITLLCLFLSFSFR